MERALGQFAAFLLRHKRLVLSSWALLCVCGAVFAAGLPGRIVSGGEAPASAESEVVSRAIDAAGRVQPTADDDEIALKKTYWEAYQQLPREIELT